MLEGPCPVHKPSSHRPEPEEHFHVPQAVLQAYSQPAEGARAWRDADPSLTLVEVTANYASLSDPQSMFRWWDGCIPSRQTLPNPGRCYRQLRFPLCSAFAIESSVEDWLQVHAQQVLMVRLGSNALEHQIICIPPSAVCLLAGG